MFKLFVLLFFITSISVSAITHDHEIQYSSGIIWSKQAGPYTARCGDAAISKDYSFTFSCTNSGMIGDLGAVESPLGSGKWKKIYSGTITTDDFSGAPHNGTGDGYSQKAFMVDIRETVFKTYRCTIIDGVHHLEQQVISTRSGYTDQQSSPSSAQNCGEHIDP